MRVETKEVVMSVFDMLPLNGVAVIKTSQESIALSVYDQISNLKIKDKDVSSLKEVLLDFKGKRNCIINSDVYDVTNEKVKMKNLEKHNLKRILIKVMEDCVPFLITVAKEEGDLDLVMHISTETENPALSVTVGLQGDVQILLFDIHYERNERIIKC